MRPGRSALGAILAVAIVATLIVNPLGLAAVERSSPVGEATAQEDLPRCQTQDLLGAAVDAITGMECGYTETDLQEIEENWLSIYTQAQVAHGAGESFRAVYDNAITSSNETAFIKAEQASLEAWNNGSSMPEGKTAAREAIREYYAIHQQNFISRWNTQIASMENLKSRDDSVSGDQIQITITDISHDSSSVYWDDTYITGFPQKNVTLGDGSEATVRGVRVTAELWDDPEQGSAYHHSSGNVTVYPTNKDRGLSAYNGGSSANVNQFWVASPPDTEYTSATLLSLILWQNDYAETEAYKTAASNRSDQLVDTLWPELDQGNINASEYLSRLSMVELYATNGGGDNATFSDVQAALAAQGFAAPNGSTAYMDLTYERVHASGLTTTDGILLSANPPENDTWELNTWYNSTEIDGAQMVATLDGEGHEIDGNFTINAALDAEGNEIEDPDMNVPDRDYQVADVEALNDRITELGDRIAELQNMTADDGAGGGGWPDIPNPLGFLAGIGQWLMIGAAVLLLLIVLSLFN